MYELMKVVYDNGKYFNLEISALEKDNFYYQLFKEFKEAECMYNPTEYDQCDIAYVECANNKEIDYDGSLQIIMRTGANEPVAQGLDLLYLLFRHMSDNMTEAQYLDFVEIVKTILNRG